VQKIRDAQDSLDGRISELEGALAGVQREIDALRAQLRRARATASGEAPLGGAAAVPAAAEAAPSLPVPGAESLDSPTQRVTA
jgi:hypothetical protein